MNTERVSPESDRLAKTIIEMVEESYRQQLARDRQAVSRRRAEAARLLAEAPLVVESHQGERTNE